MKGVFVLSMPHNWRCRLYADDPLGENDENAGTAIMCDDFADLPIEMPTSVRVFTDRAGVPLAIHLDDDGKWVRREDLRHVAWHLSIQPRSRRK